MYLIRKDGLWLLGHKASGIREFTSEGKLMDVPTCIWGNDISGAKGYAYAEQARVYADMFGGEVVFVKTKEDDDELAEADR